SDRDQTALITRLPVGPAGSVIRCAVSERQPNLRAASKRKEHRPLCATWKIKLAWQDANDRAHVAVDGNAFPQQRGISAEAPLPKPVADQRDRQTAGRFFIGSQCPAQQRCHSEGLEESGCHPCGTHTLGIAATRKVGGARGKGSEAR